jgi:hypothetical protein
MTMRLNAPLTALLACGALATCAAAAAAQTTFPASWDGDWTIIEILTTGCGQTTEVSRETRTLSIVEGDPIDAWDADLAAPGASVTINDDGFTYAATVSESQPPCTINTITTYLLTRTGDNLTGLKRVNVNVIGCGGSNCTEYQIVGNAGQVPDAAPTWSTIKALYR